MLELPNCNHAKPQTICVKRNPFLISLLVGLWGVGLWGMLDPAIGNSQEPIELVTASINGGSAICPDRWTSFQATVANNTDQDVELTLLTAFADRPFDQYGRKFLVPASSRRQVWYPLFVPFVDKNTTQVNFHTFLYEQRNGQQVAVRKTTDHLFLESPKSVRHGQMETGILFKDTLELMSMDAPYEAVLAFRGSQGYDRVTMGFLPSQWMPRIPENLLHLDNLVVTDDQLIEHPQMTRAVHDWIVGGGRCWIMLDRTGVDVTRQLLGGQCDLELVERVSLTSLELHETLTRTNYATVAKREFELPVDMCRVLATNVETIYEIDGWPAAFWVDVGKGKVLVTTINSKAWLRPRDDEDMRAIARTKAEHEMNDTNFSVIAPLTHVGLDFFHRPNDPKLTPDALQKKELISQHETSIGFVISSKRQLLYLFGGFLMSLLLGGIYLWRTERLERMLFLTPIVSMITAGAVVAMGMQARAKTDRNDVETQILRLDSTGESYVAEGLISLVNNSQLSDQVLSRHGGRFELTNNLSEGQNRQWLWTDIDQWSIDNNRFPRGMIHSSIHVTDRMVEPITAHWQLQDNGITGQIHAGDKPIEDAVFLTHRGFIPLEVDSQGRFQIAGGEKNEGKQMLFTTLLSESRIRHRDLLELMFSDHNGLQAFRQPAVAFWSAGVDAGFKLGERSPPDALFIVPAQMTPPGSQSQIHLPDVLLEYDSVNKPRPELAPELSANGSEGSQQFSNTRSGIYDGGADVWQQLSVQTDLTLRVKIPEYALPLKVEKLTVLVDALAPEMKFSFCIYSQDKQFPIGKPQTGQGRLLWSVSDPELLSLDDRGGLTIGLKIDASNQTKLESMRGMVPSWTIKDVYFDVLGRTESESEHE
jgi:hypothetical protein